MKLVAKPTRGGAILMRIKPTRARLLQIPVRGLQKNLALYGLRRYSPAAFTGSFSHTSHDRNL